MALFTRENAAEMGRRGVFARIQRERERKLAEEQERIEAMKPPLETNEDQRKQRVQKQIERCDELLSMCRDPETFVKLTAAKERLWNLIYPKPGSLKPGKPRNGLESRSPVAPIQPQPIVSPSEIVGPESIENHNANGEIRNPPESK